MEGTMQCSANYVPLSPISFLKRAAIVYGDRTAVIYGSKKYTWEETRERCHRLSSALTHLGISPGDVVAALGPNIPAIYELHYAAPMTGALICAITTRCDPPLLSDLINRSKAKIIFVDHQYLELADLALKLLPHEETNPALMIPISDSSESSPFFCSQFNPNNLEYESLISTGDPHFKIRYPDDEFDPISISYTSGTTATPKGVIHNHRAAYLNSIATILLNEMSPTPVFLWTIPMYHCNGWSFIWAVAALGGTNIILIREVSRKVIFDNIVEHNVTNLAGATPVLNMIANAPASDRKPLPHKVDVLAGGSPPPPQVLFNMEEQGFRVTHAGGQTETYCCAIYCSWRPEWDLLLAEKRARLKARQGLQHLILSEVDVKDYDTMESVPADGETIGEVVYRGNNVMSGYLDLEMTKEAFRGGWFHSGDLGVMHSDGYIELKDRVKDIVVCDGEKIGTIEIESMLFSHPAVHAAGVVGRPDERVGETLCAFVQLKEGGEATMEEIVEFCRAQLPENMVPPTVIFDEVPVTSTGKTKKCVLREKAKALGSLPNGNAEQV